MLEPWNDKSILPPPINTSQCNDNISNGKRELFYLYNFY